MGLRLEALDLVLLALDLHLEGLDEGVLLMDLLILVRLGVGHVLELLGGVLVGLNDMVAELPHVGDNLHHVLVVGDLHLCK